ncbi:MAG: hypothetical protein KDE27_13720 [Planctomycetes bacterium]|nr:hypothetical protein [Planctomycetota bacterium]
MARILPAQSAFARRPLAVAAAFAAAIALQPIPAQIQIQLMPLPVTQGVESLAAGATAPKPKWGEWRAGEPVALAKGRVAVVAFYTTSRAPSAEGDADYLADLQRRFADRDLDIVAVLPPDAEVPANLSPCRVVSDAGLATTLSWCGGDSGADNVFVLDGGGQVTFRGRLGQGVLDAMERTLNGKPEVEREQQLRSALPMVASNFDSMVGATAKLQLDPLLRHAPRDGFLLGLAYLTAATKLRDLDAATAWRESAVDRLANEPRPLAVFADLALRGVPRSVELATQLAAALVPATAVAPRDPVVQLAYLRAVVLAGMSRQAGRQAMITRKLIEGNAAHQIAFCDILTQDPVPGPHRELCEAAIAKAAALGAPPRQLAALRYTVARRCAEDEAAAEKVLAAYVGSDAQHTTLNNDCWYFMTELDTMGRHDVFAAALAGRMLQSKAQMDAFEFDTAALAMFLAGRIDDAVELQREALQKGQAGNPEYVERLKRYEAAAARQAGAAEPQPQPGGRDGGGR